MARGPLPSPIIDAPGTLMPASTPDRRSVILDAAASLIAERGYRGTTILAVAEKAGVTDAGVLYHFKTKQDLLLTVLKSFDDQLESDDNIRTMSGIDLLRASCDWGYAMELVPEIQSMLIILTAEHLFDDGEVRRFIVERQQRNLDMYRNAFRSASEGGHIRRDVDADHEARAYLAFLDGMRIQWLLSGRTISLADEVSAHMRHVLERLGDDATNADPGARVR